MLFISLVSILPVFLEREVFTSAKVGTGPAKRWIIIGDHSDLHFKMKILFTRQLSYSLVCKTMAEAGRAK